MVWIVLTDAVIAIVGGGYLVTKLNNTLPSLSGHQ